MFQYKKIILSLSLIGLVSCGNGDILDTTRPEVTDTVPTDGAESVAINSVVVVRFNEDIDDATVTTTTFTLVDADDNSVAGSVEVDSTNHIAVFTPTENLDVSTAYTATVTTGIEDSDENNLEADFGWTFTTGVDLDVVALTLDSTTPEDADANVDRGDSITVTFSESANPITLTTSALTIIDEDSNVVDYDLSYDVDTETVTLNPNADLDSNADYTVTVTTDVEDLAGNNLVADSTWTFTTGS